MRIFIKSIKIQNFRSVKSVTLNLDRECTVLIGKNNSGKSNIIKALAMAFSFSSIDKQDIFVSPEEPFDINRKILIDVLIKPVDNNGAEQPSFIDSWGRSLGNNVSIDPETDKEFFAFRTELMYDQDKEMYTNNKYKIVTWSENGDSAIGAKIGRDAIDGIDVITIDAQRDISTDLRDRRSVWGRLAAKIKVAEDISSRIQTQLGRLNKQIVGSSDVLKNIGTQLRETTGERKSTVEISPITRNIESLYKGMDIYYTDQGAVPTSVDNLGLGVRSWAVFSTVKAETLTKIEKAEREETAYHPFIMVEEPEAHIHPQAQRHLFSAINSIVGQKFVTTHSPYVLSQVELSKIRYTRKNKAYTDVSPLLMDDLDPDDIRKINRTVMNTRGEILYANAVVLAEGETEEQSLTIFLREYFNKEPFELGINVIGVGGSNYLPFMRILEKLGISWYIFSDGEVNPIRTLKNAVKNLYGLAELDSLCNYPNIFVLENGHNIETYLVSNGYKNEIINAINRIEGDLEYFNHYIRACHGKNGKDYLSAGGKERAILDCITGRGGKTKYATAIAEEICRCTTRKKRIPQKIRQLLDLINNDFISKRAGV